MHIHPVHADDLELFVEAAGTPDQRREVERYLERMFAAGSMRRQWCFVAEEEGEGSLGRVAFWTLPGMEEPFALVLLDVPWDGDPLCAFLHIYPASLDIVHSTLLWRG